MLALPTPSSGLIVLWTGSGRGKYADLLVLDRDYLAVPADEIKDIKPLMTMVGGKIVYDAMPK